ncbi:MAG: flagellar biosynthesis protein FlhA [Planctomycetota bacterium]|jgi:flagellar biosynthesis protein FlhA|nr:flagellar biosynthesis protein FlhA [Planctomycetota bacterium]
MISINNLNNFITRYRGLFMAVAIVSLPLIIIIPIPTVLIDLLLAINLTIAFIIILTTIYINQPLQFSVFPSLLLIMTLYRLVLNIATTRLILGESAPNVDQPAGKVIEAFGTFVAGNDALIGFIMFVILVIIQFVVITKGATRISEVAARFTLDGMPGKQMAIDADLNAGLIDENEARTRRDTIMREADFYGAMDGASKFVRGDAIAGIIITVINLIGGFVIGYFQRGYQLSESLEVFSKLTVGDGLITQIPAFIISIAAGLIITRDTSDMSLGEEMVGQLLTNPKPLGISSGFLFLLAWTPLPFIPMVGLSAVCGGGAFLLHQIQADRSVREKEKVRRQTPETQHKVESLLRVDPMEMEVGYGLLRLVDTSQGGDLLERITMIRRQTALELGIVIPPVRIRDNMQLEPNRYIIKIHGEEIARGDSMPDQFLAMDAGVATGKVDGIPTQEPAFGLPALWISESNRERASALGYTVVDSTTVIATHLTELIKSYSFDLLTREEVVNLLENLKESNPKIVEEVVPDVLKYADIQKVLQNLLRENVSIRNLASILETLADYGRRIQDPSLLTEYVRSSLARNISRQYQDDEGRLTCITLDPSLEELVSGSLQHTENGSFLSMSPSLMKDIMDAMGPHLENLVQSGHTAILLTSPQIRPHIKRIVDGIQPGIVVISYNEVVADVQVESVAVVTLATT